MFQDTTDREGEFTLFHAVGGLVLFVIVALSIDWVRGQMADHREARATEEHSLAWNAVSRAYDDWVELTPWVSQITNTRQAISAAVMTEAAWMVELGDLSGLMGGPLGVHDRAAQAMAEAQAQIVVKGPEVITAVDTMGRAITRMLEANAALPGAAARAAARNGARAKAQEWETAANEMMQIMIVDVFSAGDAATRFNHLTTEVMAALEGLGPVTSEYRTGSR